ncbi:hypothetical protein [Alicyclobacillus ferrooxydans]|uniref:Uncharacterized protein n=1 Tax=Alicyclobacillus ferrooxydans TaxID=471514 RepID=A0A0P9C9V9_9BACL|nr:hypothetical protein [Alicyclobacillus ferrooxydans]KPV41994.1 hypothetical protein AN477_19690 [Alicyclobacillus ferrooxydans]
MTADPIDELLDVLDQLLDDLSTALSERYGSAHIDLRISAVRAASSSFDYSSAVTRFQQRQSTFLR